MAWVSLAVLSPSSANSTPHEELCYPHETEPNCTSQQCAGIELNGAEGPCCEWTDACTGSCCHAAPEEEEDTGGCPADGEEETNPLWFVGVITSIFGSVIQNLGVNTQKYSFNQEAKRIKQRPYVLQPLWMLGLVGVIIGSLGDFVALGFAPQSLVVLVGASTIIINTFFAHFWLGEELHKLDIVATLFVLIGICIVSIFMNKGGKCYDLDGLIELYIKQTFLIYIGIVLTLATIAYLTIKHVEWLYNTKGKNHPQYMLYRKVHPILYPILSGLLGAQSVLFAKATAELIKLSLGGTNQFTSPGTYLIVMCMVLFIFNQIHWLAQGLKWFDAIFIVPVFQCFYIGISIVGGGVYFQDLAGMSLFSGMMFLLGVTITLAGVVMLSQRDMSKLKPKQRFRAAVYVVIFAYRTSKVVKRPWQPTQEGVVHKLKPDDNPAGGEGVAVEDAASPLEKTGEGPAPCPEYVPSFPPSFLPSFPPSLLPSFLPSFLPFFLPPFISYLTERIEGGRKGGRKEGR
jgi:hypothetical protein